MPVEPLRGLTKFILTREVIPVKDQSGLTNEESTRSTLWNHAPIAGRDSSDQRKSRESHSRGLESERDGLQAVGGVVGAHWTDY